MVAVQGVRHHTLNHICVNRPSRTRRGERVNYFQWAKRLASVLESTSHQPGTWYIRPSDDLVGPVEVENLFSAIRAWWLGTLRPPYTAAALRERLRQLRPFDALPLLYAMSYTARTWGRGAKFWPQFCEHVLANSVELDVIYAVAPELTNLWKVVHRFSNGALYYPPEGRSNIKWPLTHAGLLSDEEGHLDRFGNSLLSEWGFGQAEPHPLLLADVDEFQSALLTWLQEEGLGFRSFARRLASEHTGLTVAAMAQNYLRQNWARLEPATQASDQVAVLTRCRRIRPRFRYDAERNQLTLLLTDAEWPGRVDCVVVEHDGHTEIWPTYYSPSSNVTHSQSLEIPVRHSRWGSLITVRVGGEAASFSLLPSPFTAHSGAMLFDSLTGIRTRTIRPGEPYFLLLPTPLVDAEWRRDLFPEAISLGNAFRDDGYDVLAVTACELSTLLDNEDRLDQLNDDLLNAGALFRLPPWHELTRPQARLVGGLPLADRNHSIPLFHVDEPPLLEVCGAFPSGLPVTLQRLGSGNCLETISALRLPESMTVGRWLVGLFDSKDPEPGRYRLLVGSECIDFRLGDTPSTSLQPYHLSLSFCPHSAPDEGSDFGYHLLESGVFHGTAWPGAVLTVVVERPGPYADRFCHQLHTDRDGSFSFDLRSYYHGTLPPAPLEVAVESGLVRSNSVVFAERAHFRQWTAEWTELGLRFKGHVVQVAGRAPVNAIAFGDAPWNGQIWHAEGTVQPSGIVDLSFSCSHGEVRYVAVAERLPGKDELVPWLAVRIVDSSPGVSNLRLCHGSTWGAWVPWMDALAEFSSAEPEVRQLAKLTKVRSYLMERFPEVRPAQTVWFRPTAVLQADLPVLLQCDSAPRVALIATHTPLPAVDSYAADLTTPTPGVEVPPDTVSELLAGNLPAGRRVLIKEGVWSTRGVLWPADSTLDVRLEADEQLIICHDCGRILPRYGFDHHLRPSTYAHRLCRTLTPVSPGTQIDLALVVEGQPQRLAACVADLIAYTSRNRRLPPGANTSLFQWFGCVAEQYPRVPGGPTPSRWGRDVATAAGDLASIVLYPRMAISPERLAPVVAVFEQYPEAVLSIMSRLFAWVQAGGE